MKDLRKRIVKRTRRLVVKVGSALVADWPSGEDSRIFVNLAVEMSALKKERGLEFVIVSSGAIALGMKRLGLTARPSTIPERQAVAALGQGALMSRYEAAFAEKGALVAQVLLTHDDIGSRKRFLNARNTLFTLLKFGITPVINENDTVAVEEIKFGDNDKLSALVTNLAEADLFVVLTNVDGLHDANPMHNPSAKRIPLVEDVDRMDLVRLTGQTSALGTGGMASKIEAARTAAHFGIPTIVANGYASDIITRLMSAEDVGTLFLPKEDRLTSWKHWIAFSSRPIGVIKVDDGAMDALLNKGKSLLPSGIKAIDGSFDSGEVVRCVDSSGKEFARGVVNYGSTEIARIKGVKTSEVEAVLGYKVYDEVIHRDNLVIV
ncbi:MAG: glutamate 5-kinase [Deltaproteobacteria bacterium]|nr:glutamate 5-kinase [Deltaproteobacteria bacterium]